ncbi:branched-chain amino acid ABC transporter permease [Halomonas cupida]|uniref:Amino acid/amide ABC transporter membrane protein 1, HAAT family (TC 3.A.1.4.-) n=1 Tax=Halomonas cupida TaxID=44933 RepID=A0A1M7AK52_9GAMM|nr:urea ABC transporter permease subunit UrtB [Halomonas cupida]GEN22362.1 branched-chain amino acid ABC transporter permease [Halomonas cupida]SHL42769.1 amino acid/amide ABC transporter membrane protein 1, HAAT family (TC 3.A.1.4.-) [Halomonas cupida]
MGMFSAGRGLVGLVLAGLLWLSAGSALGASEASSAPDPGRGLLTELAEADYNGKKAVIDTIVASGDERSRRWLESLADGKLQRLKDSGDFVIVLRNRGREWPVVDALTFEDAGEVSRRALDRIRINNALRGYLDSSLALFDLRVDDPQARLVAARDLIGEVDESSVEPIARLLAEESDSDVVTTLELALAIQRLDQGDVEAVEVLAGNLDSRARAALSQASRSDDPTLAAAASEALTSIEQVLKINRAAETLYFGLSLGSVLVLAAIGLAITFGVMGVINMAHGELIMLGAYTTWAMQQVLPGQPGLALLLSIPAGFLVAALAGVAIERSVIQFLKGRPLETLLATFGVSLILQQLVRTVISPLNRTVVTPEWMSGSLMVNDALSLTLNRLYVLGFALLVFAALMLVMRRTRLGLEVRAVTQNRAMARAMGIRATRVDILTFALGSGVAGLAGVALSQLTNVGPNLGQNYIIDSFMVVVFGGVGNLWGTLVAGLSLGVINQVLEPWAGAVLAKILVLVFIILFIQKRPRGLFPQKGRAAEG